MSHGTRKRRTGRRQHAALPYALDGRDVRVLVVTTRETRSWVVPKGWPEKGLAPHELAAREAYEEAGVVGSAAAAAIGAFRYEKRLSAGRVVPCEVDVYPLEVTTRLDDWPERGQRERRWCTPAEAAALVRDPGLAEILLRLSRLL